MKHQIASREKQSKKIEHILEDFLGKKNFDDLTCLEVGCGTGEISAYFAEKVNKIWGIEIDPTLILKHQTSLLNNLAYAEADGSQLPFEDEHFDLVLFPQVYEHTLKQQSVVDEIYRVLKPNGLCFFSGPNRFQLFEPHYFLPFLSWMPHRMASLYLRLMNKGEVFDIYPRNYWYLKKLTKSFKRYDYTHQLIQYPQRYGLEERLGKIRLSALPVWFIQLMAPLYPNYNWILQKENER